MQVFVDGLRGYRDRRLRKHDRAGRQCRKWGQNLPDPLGKCRPAHETERDVRPELHAALLQLFETQPEIKQPVHTVQYRGRIRRSSGHAGGHRDDLSKIHLHTALEMKLVHQHLRRPVHEIVFVDRQKRQIGFQHDARPVGALQIDVVVKLHGLHDHADIMITVRALPQHVE